MPVELSHDKPAKSGKYEPSARTEDNLAARSAKPFSMQSYGISDRGQIRPTNEDRFVIVELSRVMNVLQSNVPQAKSKYGSHRGHVFLVADGMGGHEAGEVASVLTVQTIEDFLLNTLRRFTNLMVSEEQNALKELQQALVQADGRIFAASKKNPKWHGMGTTLTLAFAVDWTLFVAHAGDSRCYLYSGGRLHQLTHDHTVAAELVRQGVLPVDKAGRYPFRNIVTNVLGGSTPGVKVELHRMDLDPGDVLLLCSDGLTDKISDELIAAVLSEEQDPECACKRLVSEANRAGGNDNITVVVAQFEEGRISNGRQQPTQAASTPS